QKSILLSEVYGIAPEEQEVLPCREEHIRLAHQPPLFHTFPGDDGMFNLPGMEEISGEVGPHQAELYESEKRFRQLVEGAPEGIYINTGQCFRYLNPAALRLFGAHSPDQLVGQSVLKRYHPKYRAIAAERMRVLLEERRAVPTIEQQCFRLDGQLFDVEVSAVPFRFEGRDGAVVY